MDTNTSNLLLALDTQRQNLAANLSQKGVAASSNEGLETLVPKILDITAGSGDTSNGDIYLSIENRIRCDNYVKKICSGSGVSQIDLSEFNINWDKIRYIFGAMNNSGQSSNYGMFICLPLLLDDGNYAKSSKTEAELLTQFSQYADRIFPMFWNTENNTFYPRSGADISSNYNIAMDTIWIVKSTNIIKFRQLYQQKTSSNASSVTLNLYPNFISIGYDN